MESSSRFFFLVCTLTTFSSHRSSLSVKWPPTRTTRHYRVSFDVQVSRGFYRIWTSNRSLFFYFFFFLGREGDESLCRIGVVDKEEKVTVGWRRCVHDIYLSNPTGKRRADGHLLDAWYRDFVCIVRVGWVVLCAIRSTVKQEVFFFGVDGDRKKRGTTVSRVGFPAALHRRLQSPYFPS
jgi:hypothetical protein